MGYAEATQIINAPVEAVWNALNDIDNTAKWVAGLEDAKIISEGGYGLGALYNDYNRLGPVLQVTTWKIMEFEPMSRQVHMSDSKNLPSTMELSLIPVAEGTRLTMKVDFHFMPHLGVVGRVFESLVMNRLLSSVLRQNMRQLNEYLQQQASISRKIEVPTLKITHQDVQQAYDKAQ
jgi:carbon monoxide dehydrogenase subunit G